MQEGRNIYFTKLTPHLRHQLINGNRDISLQIYLQKKAATRGELFKIKNTRVLEGDSYRYDMGRAPISTGRCTLVHNALNSFFTNTNIKDE